MSGVRQHACAQVQCDTGADSPPSHVLIETGAVSRVVSELAGGDTYEATWHEHGPGAECQDKVRTNDRTPFLLQRKTVA